MKPWGKTYTNHTEEEDTESLPMREENFTPDPGNTEGKHTRFHYVEKHE